MGNNGENSDLEMKSERKELISPWSSSTKGSAMVTDVGGGAAVMLSVVCYCAVQSNAVAAIGRGWATANVASVSVADGC